MQRTETAVRVAVDTPDVPQPMGYLAKSHYRVVESTLAHAYLEVRSLLKDADLSTYVVAVIAERIQTRQDLLHTTWARGLTKWGPIRTSVSRRC